MVKNTKLWAAAAFAALTVAAGAASAQDSRYDGYCYVKQNDAKTTGTVLGAIAGAAIGSQVSKNERGLGAVGGAVAGGAIGRQIGKSSVKCLNGEYYAYSTGQYTPAPAPDGYAPVYYEQRPDASAYSTVYYDPDRRSTSPSDRYAYGRSYDNGYNSNYNNGYGNQAYNNNSSYSNSRRGWRDDRGQWHSGTPRAWGWRDDRGVWHEGKFEAYGYQDRDGRWHETGNTSTYGSNY